MSDPKKEEKAKAKVGAEQEAPAAAPVEKDEVEVELTAMKKMSVILKGLNAKQRESAMGWLNKRYCNPVVTADAMANREALVAAAREHGLTPPAPIKVPVIGAQ